MKVSPKEGDRSSLPLTDVMTCACSFIDMHLSALSLTASVSSFFSFFLSLSFPFSIHSSYTENSTLQRTLPTSSLPKLQPGQCARTALWAVIFQWFRVLTRFESVQEHEPTCEEHLGTIIRRSARTRLIKEEENVID